MNIEDIVKEYLKNNGFDGLADADNGCACSLNDLFPCGESCLECEPAYNVICNEKACDAREHCESPNNGKRVCWTREKLELKLEGKERAKK